MVELNNFDNEDTSLVSNGNVRSKPVRMLCRRFVRSSNRQMFSDTCSSETECNVRSGRIRDRMRSLELLDNYKGRRLIVGRAMTRGVDTLPRFQRTKVSEHET